MALAPIILNDRLLIVSLTTFSITTALFVRWEFGRIDYPGCNDILLGIKPFWELCALLVDMTLVEIGWEIQAKAMTTRAHNSQIA